MPAVSNIRRGKAEKLHALGASLAIGIARGKKDPLFAKYEHSRATMLKLKAMLIKKYGSLGAKEAKQSMTK